MNVSLLLPVAHVPLGAEIFVSAAQSVLSGFVHLMGNENSSIMLIAPVALKRPLETVALHG